MNLLQSRWYLFFKQDKVTQKSHVEAILAQIKSAFPKPERRVIILSLVILSV
jgi:hypothetical protein